MLDLVKEMDEQGKKGVAVFKKAISGHKATGETERSAYYKIEGKDTKVTLEILARAFVPVLETGSKPAKTLTPSKEMLDTLGAWAKARGIPEEAVYPIAKTLLKEGQKINRNVYSQQMDEWADEMIEIITNELAGYYVDKIVNSYAKA